MPRPLGKIGVWFSQKKRKKFNLDQLDALFRIHGYELVEIDIDRLGDQGPFAAIIHKLTDLMIEEMGGSKTAAQNIESIQRYVDQNPSLTMVDPLSSIRKILNRNETYTLLLDTKHAQDKQIHVPPFTLLTATDSATLKTQLMAANVNFPFICKKNIAHGLESHKMSIIFNEEGLADVETPCVAQTFINHGALLYKIYAIGTKFHIVKRPSLRNFADSKWSKESTIFFNSHNISSGDCTPNALSTLDVDDDQPQHINESLVQDLAKHLHIDINMSLYGADIIICTKTRRHYIIDVNVFPSYDGVEDYLQQLADHVLFKISLQ